MKKCQLDLKKSDNAGGGQARCVDGRLPQGSDVDPRLDPPCLEKDGSGAGRRPAEEGPHPLKMEEAGTVAHPELAGVLKQTNVATIRKNLSRVNVQL